MYCLNFTSRYKAANHLVLFDVSSSDTIVFLSSSLLRLNIWCLPSPDVTIELIKPQDTGQVVRQQ